MEDFNSKYTGQEVESMLDSIESKQDTLVSGTNIKTINGKSLLGSGNIQIEGGSGDVANIAERVTYDELKRKRDSGELIAGCWYRIIDYTFTTVKEDTKSAGNVFDIIVLATSENQLSELARAIQHEGDTYFDGNDLGAWELWYDLDNDVEKYAWADAENGKGVIYHMIDEKLNDCPYDFKNALFYNTTLTTGTTTDKYYYTFSYVVSGSLYDGTVEKQVNNCYGNSIGVYSTNKKKYLNLNVFINTKFMDACCSNKFGDSCYKNTFGNNCYKNTFGNSCEYNTFGYNCYNNTFGNDCYSNTFGVNCRYNTFEVFCRYNTFGNTCYNNTFGNNCEYNTFGYNCYNNTFGNSCQDNTFGFYCSSNKFGDSCYYNTFGDSCYYNTFGDSCEYRTLKMNTMYIEAKGSKTTITFNEEYLDDGSGKVVPIKHPDLSTQPSILPYKFMGQYVYEQLICLGTSAESTPSYNLPKGFLTDIAQPLGIKNPIIIRVEGFAYGRGELWNISGNYTPAPYIHGIPVTIEMKTHQSSESEVKALRTDFIAKRPSIENFGSDDVKLTYYARIVYTSMPEDGGYYGYNSY